MRHLLNFIATIFLTVSYCNSLYAQVDTTFIKQINNYIEYVDSINRLDHVQNIGFSTFVADGIIKTDDKIVGGFGIYTLSNSKGDTAFRIEYNGGVDININKTYYYKSNKLIFARLILQDAHKTIYQKEEIFNNDIILWTDTKRDKKANDYYSQTNFSLFDDGLKFLEDFKKGNKLR